MPRVSGALKNLKPMKDLEGTIDHRLQAATEGDQALISLSRS